MRSIFLAVLIACGVGLVGTGTNAAPINGGVIGQGAAAANAVEQVQHRRRRSRGHWRRGSRGWRHSRWRSRGHWRRGSRGGRCHLPIVSAWVRC